MSRFFHIEPATYEHFTLDAAGADALRNVILALCAGIILAALLVYYDRAIPGGFVRKLLAVGAFTEETAKSFAELQVKGAVILSRTVKRKNLLSRLVQTTEDGRFYIREEDKYRAEVRYEKEGNGLAGLIVTSLTAIAIALLLIRFAPAILTVYDKILK